MNPTELYAYKLKIENSDGKELNDVLTQITTLGDFPSALIPSVINALQMNKHIPFQTLCDILISTKSKELYEIAQSKSLMDNRELARLFKSGFNLPEIEKTLCQGLYKCKNDSHDLRREIVRAMAENGGNESLELLKVVEYELAPTIPELEYDLQEGHPEKANLQKILNLRSSKEFLQEVRLAKDRIVNRVTNMTDIEPRNGDSNKHDSADIVREIIKKGESKTSEFKQTFSLNIKTGIKDVYIANASLKTIVAFLNTDGGDLLVGVDDKGTKTGLRKEIDNFYQKSDDKFLRYFKEQIKTKIGGKFYPFIDYDLVEVDGEKILHVKCKPSTIPCFLEEKVFYVRGGPASDPLIGPELAGYLKIRFPHS